MVNGGNASRQVDAEGWKGRQAAGASGGVTQASVPRAKWFVVRGPAERAALRLFCFPYAGGGAAIYRRWADFMPSPLEVIPVRPPGREARLTETPFRSMAPLIAELAAEIEPWLDRPFAFFGHSMGAKIAFELARHLRATSGREPCHLFVSGSPGPRVARERELTYALPEAEFIKELRGLNGTPPEVLENAELMRLLIPLLRADFELVQTYRYEQGETLSCPVTAFGGLGDREVSREDVSAWRFETSGTFALRMLPGDHFFIHSAGSSVLLSVAQTLHHQLRRLACRA